MLHMLHKLQVFGFILYLSFFYELVSGPKTMLNMLIDLCLLDVET